LAREVEELEHVDKIVQFNLWALDSSYLVLNLKVRTTANE